jgi:glycosyltransferase involved in cell wall biosynthesis
MINGKKLIVVMPAYNAGQTLVKTFSELPHDIIDEVILVDDHSRDNTVEVARELGVQTIIRHKRNTGYGGNQKTCYAVALSRGADIVVMVHPDYQYSPRLCGAIAWMVASGEYDVVLASRILGNQALTGGMPIWKYIANRLLTAFENIMLGIRLSEYHTGYRAFTRDVLLTLPLDENTDDFAFDNQMIVQAVQFGFRIGEISCPTRYMAEASSINFRRSVVYGLGVVGASLAYRLNAWGLRRARILSADGRRLDMAHLEARLPLLEFTSPQDV